MFSFFKRGNFDLEINDNQIKILIKNNLSHIKQDITDNQPISYSSKRFENTLIRDETSHY